MSRLMQQTTWADPAARAQFIEDVLALIIAYGQHAHQRTGNRPGELSMSHLVSMLRNGDSATAYRTYTGAAVRTSGWGPTIEDVAAEAGFTVRRQQNGRAIRTYIGV